MEQRGSFGAVRLHTPTQGNGSICRNGYGNGRGPAPPGATPRSANTTHYATHYGTRYGTRYGSRYEKTAPATWPRLRIAGIPRPRHRMLPPLRR
ncbi:hypothetical protein E4K10_43770 [Streptomyces sp. T1317-0309]|nr:hypothetical protein E4K10_43770 [Streptomyces sp. T1317-0309]